MKSRTIVTPYFLDRPEPALAALSGDRLNDQLAPDGEMPERLGSLHRTIAGFVAETIAQGERPISIQGDCCAAIAVMAGLARAGVEPGIIWLDAHGDFNTPDTSPSGFLGGMPLAMIAGRGDPLMCKQVGLKPQPEERIVLSDGRDLDPGEAEAVATSDITHVRDLSEITGHLPDAPLYVHFDTDIIDAEACPAHNYPVKGGPSPDQVIEAMTALRETKRVIAVSMTCWNPSLDHDGKTAEACMEAFAALTTK